jgi:general L-amino acid transport system permease protein
VAGKPHADISQMLVESNNRATHLRAAFGGIVNPLPGAALCCIAATVVVGLAGVPRLSNNQIL